MKSAKPLILTINGGSSSIRFALYQAGGALERRLYGKIDRIGLSGTNLAFKDSTGKSLERSIMALADHKVAANFLIDWLDEQSDFKTIQAVGHRVVHGMTHSEPERVTPELLDELHRIMPYDPEHLPLEIELIEAFASRYPTLPQVACFDTAFHRTMPRVASLLPIPRRYEAAGVRRYGFHGLSYQYLMEELGAPRRSGGHEGARHPCPSRQRREPGRRAQRQEHRHQHGLHADVGTGDEQSLGGPGPGTGLLPGAHRTNECGSNFRKW